MAPAKQILLLLLVTANSFAGVGLTAARQIQAATGPTYSYSFSDIANGTRDNTVSSGFQLSSRVVATASGTCTEVAVWVTNWVSGHFKIALYRNDHSLIGSGNVEPTGDGWLTVSLSSAVTSGTTYRIGVSVSSAAGQLELVYKDVSVAGALRYNGDGYAAFPEDPFSNGGEGTTPYCVRMKIE